MELCGLGNLIKFKMQKIYYFTNSYPYDLGEEWKTNELKTLRRKFDVIVVPFYSQTKKIATKKLKNISYAEPLFNDIQYVNLRKRFVSIIFSKYFYIFIKEFLLKKSFFNKKKFFSWIASSYKMLELSRNKKLKQIFHQIDNNDIFYFFWGRETSEILPVLKIKPKPKIVVRFHGYDLYEERNYNYIPYRKEQLKKIHTAIFVSKQGRNYLKKKYAKIKFEAKTFRLGTTFKGKSKISEDNVLRIFSCSSLIALKRVDLIAKAIVNLKFKVEWTHIGGGERLSEIENIIKNRPENIDVNLLGQVSSNMVKSFYVNNFADLFINVSTTEGVPVSVMEAMSAALPILATNVGGTSEIVSAENGKLLNVDLSSNILADEITAFYYLGKNKKIEQRQKSFQKYQKMCNAEILANELLHFLLSM